MKDDEKKYFDVDYILLRDEVIKFLFDEDLYYSLYDINKIRKLLKILLKYLKRGKK